MQELVEVGDTVRLLETGEDAVVCLEETVDTSGMPDSLTTDSSVTVTTSTRDEELRMKPSSSLDTVQHTGTKQ